MRRLVIYKLELICVKYVPIIIALLSLLDNVLMYYDISLDILSYIAGTSILTTIPMYIVVMFINFVSIIGCLYII